MAVLYISEFAGPTKTNDTEVAVFQAPPVAEQTVAIGAGSVQSNPFNAATNYVEIETDAICSITFGANPVATAASMRMATNDRIVRKVFPGQKVAVIVNS
jgi:hypothetical protein